MKNKLIPIGFIATFVVASFISTHGMNRQDNCAVPHNDSGSVTLILLRHAKSDKSNMNMADISRPLEESGRVEAEEIGNFLSGEKIKIDHIISSPSVRTKQTLEIICPKIGYSFDSIEWDSTLYACTGEHLVSRVKNTNDKYKVVMYVGHNPSITAASNELQPNEQFSEVKTCGVVAIDFGVSTWNNITKESGVLRFYRKPN